MTSFHPLRWIGETFWRSNARGKAWKGNKRNKRVRCFIQRDQREPMQRGVMHVRIKEYNWEIIGKEGAGKFAPDQ